MRRLCILITFDAPGLPPGVDQEHGGLPGTALGDAVLRAPQRHTVPRISVIPRKAYGGAWHVMTPVHRGRPDLMPADQRGSRVMGADGASNVIFRLIAVEPMTSCEASARSSSGSMSELRCNLHYAAEQYRRCVIDPTETRVRYPSSGPRRCQAMGTPHLLSRKHGNLPQ